MNPLHKRRNLILTILLLLLLAFIWGQSLMSAEESTAESDWVLELATPVLELFVGKGNVTDHLVRKLAHFSEYAALGAVLLLRFGWERNRKRRLVCVHLGLCAALIDETLQLFSGRGSQLPDVWLDFGGVIFGALLAAGALTLAERKTSGRPAAKVRLSVLPHRLTVCRLPDAGVFDRSRDFYFLGRTGEEESLVCRTEDVPENAEAREDGWRAFRVEGVLDFSLVGILAGLTGALAESGVSVFAVSTYNTDYLLVREEQLDRARAALSRAGYPIGE